MFSQGPTSTHVWSNREVHSLVWCLSLGCFLGCFGSGKLSIQKLHPKLHSRSVSHLTAQTGLKVQMNPSRTVNRSSDPVPLIISNFQFVKRGGGMAVKEAMPKHLAVSAKDDMWLPFTHLQWTGKGGCEMVIGGLSFFHSVVNGENLV